MAKTFILMYILNDLRVEKFWYLEQSGKDICRLSSDYKQAGVEFAQATIQVF